MRGIVGIFNLKELEPPAHDDVAGRIPCEEVAETLGLSTQQVRDAYQDIEAKRKAALFTFAPAVDRSRTCRAALANCLMTTNKLWIIVPGAYV